MKPPPSKLTVTKAITAQSERPGERATGSASVRSRTERMFWMVAPTKVDAPYSLSIRSFFLVVQRR